MASNIILTGFNELYPVAGQDNDSQGFRTNFAVTKTGLETARDEITALQGSTAQGVVYTSVDGVNTNDFNGSIIREAEMIANTQTVYANGEKSEDYTISWLNGHYQTITLSGNFTLTIADLPASGKLGKITLEIRSKLNVARSPIFASSTGSVKTTSSFSPVIDSEANPTIIEFWTHNGGVTLFASDLGKFDT